MVKLALVAMALLSVQFPLSSFAAPAPIKGTGLTLRRNIEGDLREISASRFDDLTKKWEQKYGSAAVDPLLSIAQESGRPDEKRYIALMSAAKIGGQGVVPQVSGFLKDPSWMLRSGALRALRTMKTTEANADVFPLLRDPALVVRLEAIETLELLRAPGTAAALVGALSDPSNYHHGRALWVPQRALKALAHLRDRSVIPSLRPYLDRTQDRAMLEDTVRALNEISGRIPLTPIPLEQQVAKWKERIEKNDL